MIVVKPPSPITDYLTWIPAAALDPVIMTLSDVQTHLHALVNSCWAVCSNQIYMAYNFRTYVASALRYSSTTQRGRPLKPGLTRESLGRNIQDHGLWRAQSRRGLMCQFGGFWADYEPIMARIAQSRVKWARTVIVYPGSPGAWDGTSATAPAMTVACANNAEMPSGMIMPKAGGDLPGAEMQNEKTGPAQRRRRRRRKVQKHCRRRDCNAAMTNLNANLTVLHLALSLCTAPLLFSGNVHARRMPGAVPNLPESAAREPEWLWDSHGSWQRCATLEHSGRSRRQVA
ncbi:hypothetical protein EDB84DRAFT_1439097 [Lactarius hengduanensis]|nr:hypothetical protein EDB84DRAFT_1439097 [Lactarius hengduanensis]